MTDDATPAPIEELEKVDPRPTLEDVIPPQYGEDDRYYICSGCGGQMHVADSVPDDFEPTHGISNPCDGTFEPVTREAFLDADPTIQPLLEDAQRAYDEARGVAPEPDPED